MADVRGIYTIDRNGTATLVKSLEDTTNYFAAADSVDIQMGQGKSVMATGQNRYEGSVPVGVTHDNGVYQWKLLVKGSTVSDALAKAESFIGAGEAWRPGLFLGWTADGASSMTFFEIRGPFSVRPTYKWAQMFGAKSWIFDVSVPVSPLVRKAALQVLPFVATTTPAVLRVGAPTNPVFNPSIEMSTLGWGNSVFPNLAALTRVATGAVVGTAALQLTTDGVTNFMGADIVVPGQYPVGVPQTFSIYMRGNVGGEVVYLQVGTGTDYTATPFTLTTTPTRYSITWTPTAPVTTNVALCMFRNVTAAAVWYADAAMVNVGTTAAAYRDGNSAGWAWTGTTNLSSSYATLPATLVNPSFEVDTSGWTFQGTGTSVAFSRSLLWSTTGAGCLYMKTACGTASFYGGAVFDNTNQLFLPVSPGEIVTASADQRTVSGPAGATAYMVAQFFDISGAYISGIQTASVDNSSAGAGDHLGLSLSGAAPAGSSYVRLLLFHGVGATTGTVETFWDNVKISVPQMAQVGGNAPALTDLAIRTSGGSAAPIWALIAWWKRVTATPLSGSVAPIGIIEAESGTMTTWSSVANAAYRGGNGAQATTSGAGTAQTLITVDPSVLTPDDFTQNTIDVEVWVDYRLASTVVSPRLIASMTPTSGFGATRYTELGASGRLLTLPSAGTVKRLTRLGVLTMPVDTLTPVKWDLKIAASWAAGSSGAFGADYVMLVPARQRACSRTGVANDSGFPKFIASTSDTTKTVRADLSGAVASATANAGADTGLGGSRLWLPPGNVDLLVKLSSTVPDDPTVDASDEQLSHTGVTGSVSLVNRNWLAV